MSIQRPFSHIITASTSWKRYAISNNSIHSAPRLRLCHSCAGRYGAFLSDIRSKRSILRSAFTDVCLTHRAAFPSDGYSNRGHSSYLSPRLAACGRKSLACERCAFCFLTKAEDRASQQQLNVAELRSCVQPVSSALSEQKHHSLPPEVLSLICVTLQSSAQNLFSQCQLAKPKPAICVSSWLFIGITPLLS